MNAKTLVAATLMLLSGTTAAFAAEAPAPAAADKLNLPMLNAPSDTSRKEARAEAVDVLKNYKTTLSVQLELYKP